MCVSDDAFKRVMDPINLQRIVALLRQQAVTRTRTETKNKTSSLPPQTRTKSGTAAVRELEQNIIQRIKSLPQQSPDFSLDNASQIFIEAILTWQFGEDFAQDTRFPELSREIRLMMQCEPTLEAQFQHFLKQLTR